MVGGANFSAGTGGDVGSLDAVASENGHPEMAVADADWRGVGFGAGLGGGAIVF